MARSFSVFSFALKLSFFFLIATNFVFALPKGIYSSKEDDVKNFQPSTSLAHMSQPDEFDSIPKNCYHFFVSQNMSSLLADATRMLRQVREQREREWILTFIRRIKSLAEHIRSHPDSRNYDCLTDLESRKRMLGMRIQQPELYFEEEELHNQKRASLQQQKLRDVSSESNESIMPELQNSGKTAIDNQNSQQQPTKQQPPLNFPPKDDASVIRSTPSADENIHPDFNQRASDVHISTETAHSQPEVASPVHLGPGREESPTQSAEALPYHGATDNVIVLSSNPNCEPRVGCGDPRAKIPTEGGIFGDDDLLVQQFYASNGLEEDENEQEALKMRIKKALLEEMAPEVKKLKTVGGTQEDLLNLWKRTEEKIDKVSEPYHDFDYEETGAAAGDLNSADRYPESDPSVPPSAEQVKNFKRESASSENSPYDDNDVLVQQLFDVRFNEPPPKTTRSLNDQNEEYLITSTILPN